MGNTGEPISTLDNYVQLSTIIDSEREISWIVFSPAPQIAKFVA